MECKCDLKILGEGLLTTNEDRVPDGNDIHKEGMTVGEGRNIGFVRYQFFYNNHYTIT